ncbi:putative alpha-1-3-mannosyltransferase [Penicillium cosmopolitanum]|uniref:Alpha-1-3-mannosyltransferase n=1 Tax=Penicillium cosmopolitanum TaxID=1131564 RepID=A0A9X0B5F1_9EURO|nr:putative alpha-1-3-mannosyltransferase [Penicillium cosmopolitanum]KAJ5388687.1 putative alpha-1-3-mannosyltransferase [Penicillium cosmopolitanum]
MGKAGGLKEIKLHHRRPRRVFVQIAFIASIVWVFYHTLSSLGGKLYPDLPAEKPQQPKEWENHSAFTQSLSNVLALLPDEQRTQRLLTPIESTGEQRMKEFGIRTRQYKQLFDAWEKLHINKTKSQRFVQDDVLQRLYQNPSIATFLERDMTEIVHNYESYRSIVTQLSTLLFPWTAPYFADHLQLRQQLHSAPRGLVFSAGNDQVRYLLTSIPAIRRLGCQLPIEVMYLGDDDLRPSSRTALEQLPGVITRDLRKMVNDKGWALRGWAGKPFAVLFSSFREVIFIDADSLFLQNPEILFDDFAYRETGALFFKDRLMFPESKREWMQKVLPEPVSSKAQQTRLWDGQSGHMQESGVLVLDTYKHFLSLLLVTRMNGPDRDGDEKKGIRGVYDMLFGDKETFWLGWELAGDTDYAFHNGSVGTIGVAHAETPRPAPSTAAGLSTPSKEYTVCAPQLLHLDRMGRPLWFNGWLLENKFAKAGEKRPAKFEAYVREEGRVPDWQLRESNMACLTSKKMFSLSQEESDVLDMTIAFGRRCEAF